MDTYVILRREAWPSDKEAQNAGSRSKIAVQEKMSGKVVWIRSYLIKEDDGKVGSVCIYQATSPEAIREHAGFADLPVDAIIRVDTTVVIRPDPED